MSRVLVVDDVAAFRLLACTVLSFEGYELQEAECGPQAVMVAANNQPDLVLIDIWMPGPYDGLEACRRIRALPGLSHLPVIMLTASDEASSRAQARMAGAVDYLVKPFLPSDLIRKVRTFIPDLCVEQTLLTRFGDWN